MKPRVGRLELEAFSYLPVDKLPNATGLAMLDFRPLEAPMRAALEVLWPHPRGDSHSVRLKVVVDNPNRSPITFCEQGHLGEAESRVSANLAAPINDALRPLRKHWATALSWDTSYTVSMTGRQLTKGERSDDEV